jgi:hypothetical protein
MVSQLPVQTVVGRLPPLALAVGTCRAGHVGVGGGVRKSDGVPEHGSHETKCATRERRGDKKSSKACTCTKSCGHLYTYPCAPFYRETKGLLHFENTLESREYSQCEHVHKRLLHPVIYGANFIYLQDCH